MLPTLAALSLNLVAVLGLVALAIPLLSMANFAASTEPPPVTDPVMLGIEAIRAQVVRLGDETTASKKVTEERLRAVEQAVASSRLSGFNTEGRATADTAPKGRIVTGLMRAKLLERNGRSPDAAWKGFEAERAAFSTGDSEAGNFIQPEVDPFVMKFLRPNLILGQLGVRMLNGRGIPHKLVEIATGPTGAWVGDTNPSVTESKGSTAVKEVKPSMYGMLVKVDRTALQDATIDLEAEIRDEMQRKISEDFDSVFFNGTGSSFQPRGILNYSEFQVGGAQVHAIGATGGVAKFEHVAKLIGKLEDANAMPPDGKITFVSHPKVRRLLKNERILQYSGDTSGGVYIPGSPIMSDAQFEAAIGHKWLVSTQLPITDVKSTTLTCSPILAGNWADCVFVTWPGTEIIPLFEVGATANQVWFLVFKRAGLLCQRVASLAAIRDADIATA